jgi:hypothetical protein
LSRSSLRPYKISKGVRAIKSTRRINKKAVIISLLVFVLIIVLWITRVIPSGLSILAANSYVHKNYPEREFKYRSVEYSSVHDDYLVHYADKDGKDYTLLVSPENFQILHDPLKIV